jgi:uncharacterized membrane protein
MLKCRCDLLSLRFVAPPVRSFAQGWHHDGMTHSLTAPTSATLSTRVQWTRGITLFSLVALIALGLAWELWLAPTGSGRLAIKVVPLLLPLVGLLRNRLYTFRWLSLLVWLYFAEGMVRATTERGISLWLALTEVLLCLLMFAACAAHVRWRLRVAKTIR